MNEAETLAANLYELSSDMDAVDYADDLDDWKEYQEWTARRRAIKEKNKDPDIGKVRKKINSFRPLFRDITEPASFSYTNLEIKIVDSFDKKNVAGQMDSENMTMYILKNCTDKDSLLLHELTHLHIYMLRENEPAKYYIPLLKKVKSKIPYLDILLGTRDSVLPLVQIDTTFPDPISHNNLFFVKSLDLDLRKGYPLGTVFGYEMAKVIRFIKKEMNGGATWQ